MNELEPHETGGRSRGRDVLRWIAVLPAALVAALAGSGTIYGLCYTILAPRRAGEPPLAGALATVLEILTHVPSGILFVVAGSLVAPRLRLTTALVLAACWFGLSLFTHVLTQNRIGQTNVRHVVLEVFGAAIGVACVRFVEARRRAIEQPQ